MREGLAAEPSDPRPGAGGPLVAAAAVRLDDLQELTHGLRADLVQRGEFLPSSWVEEAAAQLRSGELQGWVLTGPPASGLAFLSPRARRAYGHVHVPPGPDGLARVHRLMEPLRTVAASVPRPRIDVGVTGLDAPGEEALAAHVPAGESLLFRDCLEWTLPPAPPSAPEPPAGWRAGGIGDVPLSQLARVDWAAFQGTPDASLVADTVEDDERVLREIRENRLGRFLPEASTVLFDPTGTVTAFLMTAEQTPRRAIFLDLVVRTDARRRGVGRYLLTWGARALAALGYESVRLWVSESNEAARRLYASIGFVPHSRAVIYRFGGDTAEPQPQRSR